MTISQTIDPPLVTDSTATFNSKAFAAWAALNTWASQANALAGDVDASAGTASSAAVSAAASAATAQVTGPAWVSGTTYAIGNPVYSPLNYQTYRRKTAGAGTTDPSIDPTNWAPLTAIFSGLAAGVIDLVTGPSIASASTVNLDAATGNRVHITGTTTITAVTLTRGPRTVIFDGALTLTHHATNNNLPGAANITTAAGDRAVYESDGTTVYCVAYTRADGTPVVAPASGLVPLTTIVASGASTVDFTTQFTSTYDTYKIIVSGLHGNGSRFFGLQALMKKAGAFITSALYERGGTYFVAGGLTSLDASSQTSAPIGIETAPAEAKAGSFEIDIYNINSTTKRTLMCFRFSGYDLNSSAAFIQHGFCNVSTLGVLQGIRFQPGGGSLYGTFSLYGIKS